MCWIDVKTQLPEEGSIVDVWAVMPGRGRGFRVTDINFFNGRFISVFAGLVTHWRYPPAPPESANVAN